MKAIRINNYIIEEPLINIINKLQIILTNGKLRDVKVTASEIIVTCPNDDHDNGHEKNPDCHINLDDNNKHVPYGGFHCFACGAAGAFVRFVALCFSSSTDYASNWLIKNYGVASGEFFDLGDDIKIPVPHKTVITRLDKSSLDTYQSWCPYLAKRKLDRDICEKFHVKYDTFHRQVVFPIYDINDNLVMLARRNIDNKFFHMDKNIDKPVYALNIIKKNNVKTCMIVEGPIDCLSCWSNGIPAIATLGSVSEEQIAQINASGITSLYLAFDNDSAGHKFTKYVEAKLNNTIMTTQIKLPAGRKDVNDLTPEEWKNLINNYFKS